MITDNQTNNKPWQWKKGQSGNILGRPKGKTMKEWAKGYLERMTDEERDEFMQGIPKEVIWKMSEGNPHQTEDSQITHVIPTIQVAETILNKNDSNPSPSAEQNSK